MKKLSLVLAAAASLLHCGPGTQTADSGTPQTEADAGARPGFTLSAPEELTTAEDTALGIAESSIAVTSTESFQLTLSATGGTLDGTTCQATSGGLICTATQSTLGAALTGLRFTPTPNFHGAATLKLRLADANDAIVSSAVTIITVTPVNDAPSAPASVLLSPALATVSSLLVCTPTAARDIDGDEVSFVYRWDVNGTTLAATGATLQNPTTGLSFASGDVVRCHVKATDGVATSAETSSAALTLSNTAPSAPTVTLAPSLAYETSLLTCSATTPSDADQDTVSLSTAWFVDGTSQGDGGSTLGGASFSRGDVVYCSVTANDGLDMTTGNSPSVTILNSAPTALTPALSPTPATKSAPIVCAATGTDPDGDALTFDIGWAINGAPVAFSGASLPPLAFQRSQSIQCRARANDGAALSSEVQSATITVQNAPPVLSSAALSTTTLNSNASVTCLPGAASDADADPITFRYQWFKNSAPMASQTSATLTTTLSVGDVVYCQVTPDDSIDLGAAVTTAPATVTNGAPTLSSVALSPSLILATTTVTCVPGSATDPDGDPITFTYEWLKNGAPISGQTGATLSSAFVKGDTLECRVTPSDGTNQGAKVTSFSVSVSNSPPALSTASIMPTPVFTDTTVTCIAGAATDADGDTVTIDYLWEKNGVTLTGQTSSTLSGALFAKGDQLRCRVTPTDGTFFGSAVFSSAITVSNTPPVALTASLSPSTAYEATTLSCASSSSDVDADAVTYSYAWLVNGATIGATSATLTGSSFQRGQTVQCRVTPFDGTSSGTPVSSNVVTISNTAPTLTSVSISPSVLYTDTTATCVPTGAADADGDTVTFAYAWLKNGVLLSATTGSLAATNFVKGDVIVCRVTPNDGTVNGAQTASASYTVSNSLPTPPVVNITPPSPTPSSTLTCNINTPSTDADGDTITYTYVWRRNGVNTSVTTSTAPPGTFTSGNTASCIVTPNDGTMSGGNGSASVVVQ